MRKTVIRIALWAGAGFLVSAGWGFYFASANKAIPIEPVVYTLGRLSQPGAWVVSHFIDGPHALTWVVFENAAAYALIGLIVETIRRHYRRVRISH